MGPTNHWQLNFCRRVARKQSPTIYIACAISTPEFFSRLALYIA